MKVYEIPSVILTAIDAADIISVSYDINTNVNIDSRDIHDFNNLIK